MKVLNFGLSLHIYLKTKQILKKKLEQLTNIAKRRNMVQELVVQEEKTKVIKQITKIDKERIGFKPDKGQNQWSRLCQNSGNVNRRPVPYTTHDELIKKGFVNNNGEYERKVKSEKIQAAKLDDGTGNSVYWACNPEDNKEYVHIGFLSRSNNPNGLCMPCCFKKDQSIGANKPKRDYFNKCIGQQSNNKESNELVQNMGEKLYILQETNKVQNGRFIYLPKYLDIFFNKNWNHDNKIKNHYLYESKSGYYFKYTIKHENNNFIKRTAISCRFCILQF
jgi:hypothetical protein